jgi:hypothetical protein
MLAAWMAAAERRDALHDAKIAGFLACGVNRRRVCTPIGALTPGIARRQVGSFGC